MEPPSQSRCTAAKLAQLVLLACAVALTFAQELHNGLHVDVTHKVECERESRTGDTLRMHYRGSLTDGSVFDSSYQRNEPFSFTLGAGEVIQGWDEGLLSMCPGEKRRITVPPELAYGHRDLPGIPRDSTLIFEALLISINGIAESVPTNMSDSDTFDDDDDDERPGAPSKPATSEDTIESSSTGHIQASNSTKRPNPDLEPGSQDGECKLLGEFAIFVQGGLGLLALFSVVWKRYRERPRRPVKVWFFDVSKQVFGSAILHVANLLMSMMGAGDYEMASTAKNVQDDAGRSPNPCSLYLINIAVDTTLGIPILVLLLKVLHAFFGLTPLARPPESIKSGYYGQPPHITWWLKQSFIYFIGLLLMKLCVLLIFLVFPWIALAGDWALRWTEGSEALQITFVMFVFPLFMNALQYYIVDSFIKDRTHGGHEPVPTEDPDDNEARQPLQGNNSYERDDDSLPRKSDDPEAAIMSTHPERNFKRTAEMRDNEGSGDGRNGDAHKDDLESRRQK